MRLAYQVEVGAAEHGAFECLDAVDLAFDGAGAVGQAESGGDRGVVAAQACHEGVQAGRSSDSTACIQRVPAATTYRIQNRSPTRRPYASVHGPLFAVADLLHPYRNPPGEHEIGQRRIDHSKIMEEGRTELRVR
jgi:hypothetical protein